MAKRVSSGLERVSTFLKDRTKDRNLIQRGKAEIIKAKALRDQNRSKEFYKTQRHKAWAKRMAQAVASASAAAASSAKSNADARARADSSVQVWNSIINGQPNSASANQDTSETASIATPTTEVGGGGLRE